MNIFISTRHAYKLSRSLLTSRHAFIFHNSRPQQQQRSQSSQLSRQSLENTKAEHSQFLSNASPTSKWKDENNNGIVDQTENQLDDVKEGQGKLLPTSTHLFKLTLPLNTLASQLRVPEPPKRGRKAAAKPDNKPESNTSTIPTVILLHPSQPLSHASRLILASLPRQISPESLSITFRSSSGETQLQWSDSTDVGDFIRDAASAAQFVISFARESSGDEVNMFVRVPTFADRTRFLRRRLDVINTELSSMEELKRECDREAHRGARRMAVGGFGMLVVYWAAVARLTFWDYGWDIMEPITYLSGLSTVICGYLWFLYQGREVSYSSVLNRSVSSRREALYKSKGLDIEKWSDLVHERRSLMQEIGRIKEDYEGGEKEKQLEKEEEEDIEAQEAKEDLEEAETKSKV